MKFHYEFDIQPPEKLIHHQQKLMLMGSCFTENIGEKLSRYKFTVLENPNGILFNPVSVSEAITQYIEEKVFTSADLFLLNESWHSWKHHSRYSGITPEDALQKINQSTAQAHQFLKNADQIMITLGSAWVYTLTEKAANAKKTAVAANNHKAPADWFAKKLLTIEEVLSMLDHMIHRLFHFNPKLQIIFTISPVRHLREGVIENNKSKAVLIQAVHHLVEKFDRLYYFPAYELVIDDLRDYRFYAEDLVHPNYHATQYVWEKLVNACMSEETQAVLKEIEPIRLAVQHKPFNPSTQQHQQFVQTYLHKAIQMEKQYPYISWKEEIAYLASCLHK
ncbi:MAG: GSCFA domain-containing protein [Chitinophagaceae bacterium]|nr:GSCFA domain-containing protein [Chitinophagaceae bacterium]